MHHLPYGVLRIAIADVGGAPYRMVQGGGLGVVVCWMLDFKERLTNKLTVHWLFGADCRQYVDKAFAFIEGNNLFFLKVLTWV